MLEEEFFRNLPNRIGYQKISAIFEYRRQLIAFFAEELRAIASKPLARPNYDLKRLEGPIDDTDLTI